MMSIMIIFCFLLLLSSLPISPVITRETIMQLKDLSVVRAGVIGYDNDHLDTLYKGFDDWD